MTLTMRPDDVLLLDMDGVLAGLDIRTWEVTLELGLRCDVELHHTNQRHRYMTEHLHEDDRQAIFDVIYAPGFFEALPVLPGAVEGVERLLAACEKVGSGLMVASKPLVGTRTSDSEKRSWLHDNFPALAEGAMFVPDKSMLHGALLLDDAIVAAEAARASWKPVIFDTTYNGVGSPWEHWDRWTWTDPLANLHPMFRNLGENQ